MSNSNVGRQERAWGDTAVDGLLAGLIGGLLMCLFLILTGWLNREAPLVSLGYFDPAQSGSWLSGLLAHLAVSAIYGVVLALLLRGMSRPHPAHAPLAWLWGGVYGLLLWGVATAVASPLDQIPAWEFGLAHLLYGMAVGYRLQTNE